MSKTLNQLLASNGMFCVDARNGTPRDIVGNLPYTVVGAPVMTQGQGVLLRREASLPLLSYGDNFNVTDISVARSWMVRARSFGVASSKSNIFHKEDGTGFGWGFSHNSGGTNQIMFEIVASWTAGHYMQVAPAAPVPPGQWFTAIATYDGSGQGTGLRIHVSSGSTVGTGSISDASVITAAPLQIGASFSTWTAGMQVQLAAIFNKQLSGSECATLIEEIRRETPPGLFDAPKRKFSFPHKTLTPAQAVAQGLVLDTDFVRRSDGKVRNLAPTAYAGTLVGNPVPAQEGEGITTDGVDDDVSFGDVTQLNGAAKASVSGWFKVHTLAAAKGLWSKSNVGIHRVGLTLFSNPPFSGLYVFATNWNPPGVAYGEAPTGTISQGVWQHLTYVFDGGGATAADKLKLYADGVPVTLTYNGTLDTVLANSVGTPLRTGSEGGTVGRYANETVRSLRVRAGVALTAAQVRAEYLEGAKRVITDGRLRADGSCPVSLTSLGQAGRAIPGTPWTLIGSAADAYVREAVDLRRYLALRWGTIAAVQGEAFGSWFFETEVGTGANYSFMPIAGSRLAYNAATQTGYIVQVSDVSLTFGVVSAGVVTALIGPLAGDYRQRRMFWLTRTPAGVFSLYMRDASGMWELLGTATDTTYMTSSQMILYGGTNTPSLYQTLQFQGAMVPTEAEALGLIPMQSAALPLGPFTTTDVSQEWNINVANGETYGVDWGDGTYESFVGTGGFDTITHTYAAPGTYNPVWWFQPATLTYFNGTSNSLSGSVPDVSSFTALQTLILSNNAFTGDLPDPTPLVNLVTYRMRNNAFSGYTSGTVALTCTMWRAEANSLPAAAVNAVLAAFATNLASRPGAGTINLGDVGNAAPTGQGLVDKAAIIAHGWTVTTN